MRQCPSCFGGMEMAGSEGQQLPDGRVEERRHWRCRNCGQQAQETQVHGAPRPATPGARRDELRKLNSEINKLGGIVMRYGPTKARRAGRRRAELIKRRNAVLEAEKERAALRRQQHERAEELAYEASPLGQLDLAVDRVRAVGRGEPWAADDPHWTEREPTDRQRKFMESRGEAVRHDENRGAVSRRIGAIKEREALPQASAHVAVDAQGNTLRVDQGATLDRLVVDRLGARMA